MNFAHVDYSRLPAHMREGMRLYVEEGIAPGGFAVPVLSDSLVGAYSRADDVNTQRMLDWAYWLYNEAPSGCWGSPEIVSAWMKARRVTCRLQGAAVMPWQAMPHVRRRECVGRGRVGLAGAETTMSPISLMPLTGARLAPKPRRDHDRGHRTSLAGWRVHEPPEPPGLAAWTAPNTWATQSRSRIALMRNIAAISLPSGD